MEEYNLKQTIASAPNPLLERNPGVIDTPVDVTSDGFGQASVDLHQSIIDTAGVIDEILQRMDEAFSQAEASLDNLLKSSTYLNSQPTDSPIDSVIDSCECPKKIAESHWAGSIKPSHDLSAEVKQPARLSEQPEMGNAEESCTHQKPQQQGGAEDVEVLVATRSDERREQAGSVPHPNTEHLRSARPRGFLCGQRGLGQQRLRTWCRRFVCPACLASSKQE